MRNQPRLSRGYESSSQVEALVEAFNRPAPWRILFDGMGFLLSLFAAAIGVAILVKSEWFKTEGYWVLPLYPLLAVLCARQLRALELIVHDASHKNFIREKEFWNVFVANTLFATPVAQSVTQYWATHSLHHRRFGTSEDPCRNRMLHLSRLDGGVEQGLSLMRWFGRKAAFYWRYSTDYYRTVAREAPWARFVVWHLAAGSLSGLAAHALTGIGLWPWAISWLLVWIVPMFIFLPIQRLLAERGEHDYESGETEFTSTIMNLGFWHRLILHPWHDSYHLLHHLHPQIPQCYHRAVHRRLDRIDPVYRASKRRWTVRGPVSEGGGT